MYLHQGKMNEWDLVIQVGSWTHLVQFSPKEQWPPMPNVLGGRHEGSQNAVKIGSF